MQYNNHMQWHLRRSIDQDNKSEQEEDERWRLRKSKTTKLKGSWMLLAWAFVIAESLRFGGNQSWAATSEDQDESDGEDNAVGLGAAANQFDDLASLDENDGDSNGAIQVKLTTPVDVTLISNESFSQEVLAGSGGALENNLSGSLLSRLNGPNSNSESDFSPTAPIDLGPPPPLPDFVFFDGLDGFASDIGLGSGFLSIIDAVDSSFQGDVSLALAFANDAFAPVGLWTGLGEFNANQGLSGWDGFSLEWAIQATATIEGESFQLTSNNGLDTQISDQYSAAEGDVTGNEIVAIDGQDWDGALRVSGDYYEFNTIIQLNIMWDGDVITATNEGSQEAYLPSQINAGQNTQLNQAQIFENAPTSEVEDQSDEDLQEVYEAQVEEYDQLLHGGGLTNNAVIQRNAIIDNDNIGYSIGGLIEGAGQSAPVGGEADVYGSGQTQDNESLLVTGGFEDASISRGAFSSYLNDLYDAEQITNIYGNYYEFNTIVQINIVSDVDEVNWFSDGPAAGDVIASGGNIQLNQATLIHDDQQDNLYVGGVYTEYNLVLQVNALEDNDAIEQVNSLIDTLLGTDPADDGLAVDYSNDQGEDGEDGLTQDDVNVILPNVLDELTIQNPSLDAFI